MAKISLPDANAAMVARDTLAPTEVWYRILNRLMTAFASAEAVITDAVGDIGALPVATQVWDTHAFIEYPDNKTYVLILKAGHALTITETVTDCTTGTATATFRINGTPLGGTANAVSTTEQSQAHASANVMASGDTLEVVVSENAACENMQISIIGTRVLATA